MHDSAISWLGPELLVFFFFRDPGGLGVDLTPFGVPGDVIVLPAEVPSCGGHLQILFSAIGSGSSTKDLHNLGGRITRKTQSFKNLTV